MNSISASVSVAKLTISFTIFASALHYVEPLCQYENVTTSTFEFLVSGGFLQCILSLVVPLLKQFCVTLACFNLLLNFHLLPILS